ncbi:SDR family oxidoreductase [Cytophagaceae bacterium YF14B1]|uniref:SDR family oxidoreductase n=1 Tax=Xanthocytophaga flava TaxID=3048013 RepID=A0AAE3UBD1_9BACT|nr:SDR family oxidoreductase [Xanthocytophaga flavus]MDJ1486391.1 SDR family oxidoreductase [Xanthocytophaga flavus]
MKNNFVTNELEGKVAIVTGAANGIGKATAVLLHSRGVKVIAEDYKADVHKLAEEYKGIVPLQADVTQEESAKKVVQLALERFGKLDILVNNAGRIVNKLVTETTLEEWQLIMDTNVTGAFLHTKEALKAMIPNKTGAIVNIASYASFFVFPTISAYTASKGALAQLTRTAAVENIEHGIRINAIGVGDVVTNLINELREDGREFLAEHGKLAPIKRAADPMEIAEIVSFLASDRASFMVGSIVMADGGMSTIIQ